MDALYDFFVTKDDKLNHPHISEIELKWKGSLEDLKAFELTEIDEVETAESSSW